MLLAALVVLLLAGVGAYAYLFLQRSGDSKRKASAAAAATHAAPPTSAPKVKAPKVDITAKNAAARKASDVSSEAPPSDPALLHRHLRGHQGELTAMAVGPDARHIATVALDEQLRLWTVVEQEKNAHFARHNLAKGEHGSAVTISHDDKYVFVALEPKRSIAIFGIKDERKAAGPHHSFLTPLHSFATPHKQPVTSLLLTSNSSAVCTMAAGSVDLAVHVFSVKGALLHTISVAQLVNHSLALSADARFLAVATKLNDTKIYEFIYAKSSLKGAAASAPSVSPPVLDRVEHAMTLRGHKRGVKCVSFGSASSGGLVVSGSVDGSFTEHSIAVNYQSSRGQGQGADPQLIARTQTDLPSVEHLDVMPVRPEHEGAPPLIALSSGSTLQFWRGTHATKGAAKLLVSIPHAHKGAITSLAFNRPQAGDHKARDYLVTAGEGRTISLWDLPHME